MSKKTVSLVLGSGGARGMAHVGVIKYLEDNNYEIKAISGCSMGALIGGFYAAGKLDAYVEWVENIDVIDMLKLLDFKGSGGLVSGKFIMEKMEELLGDYTIEDLPIEYTAVATDIDAEKEVWINKGSLLKAIRASISLPLFFTPYEYKGKLLVDGGVLNPVPIAPTFDDFTNITIAVNLGGDATTDPIVKKKSEDRTWSSKIKDYMAKISLPDSVANENGMYVIADKSFESMQSTIARIKLSAYPPDIEIDIPKNLCGTFEFNKAKEVVDYGYEICVKKFNEL